MTSRVDLSFEPPEPPPHREWPEYVRLSYGAMDVLPESLASDNEQAYPHGYLGWMIRMGHHLPTLLDEQTTRVSDEAVLAAALLQDLQAVRTQYRDDALAVELLDEVQGRLLAGLRGLSLPTGVGVYREEEAVAVLDRWSSPLERSRTHGDFVLGEYLDAVEEVLAARGTPQVLRRQSSVETLTGQELQAHVAARLRALAEQVETGELEIGEMQTLDRAGGVEVRLRGRAGQRSAPGFLATPCPECV